jgi:hypothetical protein
MTVAPLTAIATNQLLLLSSRCAAMKDTERYRLLYGPYRAPPFRFGDVVFCERRGEVKIVGLSSGRIPWPMGERNGQRSLILFGALADAVRLESAVAVAYWWGASPWLTWQWRNTLRVGPLNDGTSALRGRVMAGEHGESMRNLSRAKDRDPIRRVKIADSKRGKPRPAHVVEAMRQGKTGRVHTDEERRKRSESHRRLGTRPPKAGRAWTAAEDKLLRTLAAAEVARRTGRRLQAVYDRRHELRLPDGRRRPMR